MPFLSKQLIIYVKDFIHILSLTTPFKTKTWVFKENRTSKIVKLDDFSRFDKINANQFLFYFLGILRFQVLRNLIPIFCLPCLTMRVGPLKVKGSIST